MMSTSFASTRPGCCRSMPFGWERYVGLEGAIIGVADFGASAPGPVLMREFGFTPERVVEAARRVLKR
jgi:transketolase